MAGDCVDGGSDRYRAPLGEEELINCDFLGMDEKTDVANVAKRMSHLERQVRNLKIAVIVVVLYFIYDAVTVLDFESLHRTDGAPKTAEIASPSPE